MTNINVEIDEELHRELKIIALQKGIDFHDYIRTVLQEASWKKEAQKNDKGTKRSD